MIPNQFLDQFNQSSANLLSASRKFSAISGAMREEIADTGLAYIAVLLYNVATKQPASLDSAAYDDFLHNLQGIVGIVVLIAGSTSAPSPLWRDFQLIAAELLETLTELKKIRSAIH